jgi:tRNA modification GTPase
MDTAGIRDSSDTVEIIGIQKSLDTIKQAVVVLFVADGSKPLEEEDVNILNAIGSTRTIVVLNKSDIGVSEKTENYFAKYDTVAVSALAGQGVGELENKLTSFAEMQGEEIANTAMITNARHKALLLSAFDSIDTAVENIKNGMPVDFVETDIRECWETLGKITGETVSEEIIDEIFANFCLGK